MNKLRNKNIIFNIVAIAVILFLLVLFGKLVIYDSIPRLALIEKLSVADFLINITNLSTVQTPSKLIDYGIAKRPVLNISNNFEEKDSFNEFLKGDYSHQAVLPDLARYDIKHVAKQFLDLVNDTNES